MARILPQIYEGDMAVQTVIEIGVGPGGLAEKAFLQAVKFSPLLRCQLMAWSRKNTADGIAPGKLFDQISGSGGAMINLDLLLWQNFFRQRLKEKLCDPPAIRLQKMSRRSLFSLSQLMRSNAADPSPIP